MGVGEILPFRLGSKDVLRLINTVTEREEGFRNVYTDSF